MAWTQLPDLRDNFRQLLAVEGIEGNTRWDLWAGTVSSWRRSPVVGSGLGSYRHVIGLDKPATGTLVLEQAHNDWLEWASTSGLVGAGVLVLVVGGLVLALRPKTVRSRRFEFRYPLAGASAALTSTTLHEMVGFGLQTPLNLYLLAAWAGLVWGVAARASGRTPPKSSSEPEGDHPGPTGGVA
jgi:O-antigen ligase